MDYLQRFIEGIKAHLKRFTFSQLLMMAVIFILSLVGLLMLAGVFKAVSYGVLYADLSSEEAGQVTARLDEMAVKYQLGDGGRMIKIPSQQVYQTRISLATMGIPSGGSVGYSIFDKTNLGMTDFVQKVNYRRALEGELGRTISGLEEVQAARVHIVIPEKRLFEEDQKETTASVVLKLSGAGSLSRRQLFGITHLVASSVEGLKSDNITVIDNWGNLLTSAQGGDPLAAMSANQLEMKKSVETYLEDKAQSILSSVFGNSRAIVRVSADLDFDQVNRSNETYDPDKTAVRSEERQEFNSADSSSSVGGDTLNSGGKEISERVITNYEVSRSVETIVSSVGNIKKLSVAIMIDGKYEEAKNDNGDLEKKYIPREDAELQQISSIVQRAVGFDSTRNDELSIVNFAFDTSDLEKEQIELDKMGQKTFYFEIGKKVLMVLGLLLAFFYVKGKIKKVFKAITKMSPPAVAPRPIRPVEEEIVMEPPKPKLIDKMKAVAEEQPEEVTRVIKTIMSE